MINDLNRVFSENPVSLDMRRSKFTMNQTHKTSISQGDLVPIYFREVLPGDTFSVDTSFLIRMATPIFPVMDNAFIDIYYFYVPNRIVWQHWKEFMGENTSAPWTQTVEYSVPQIKIGGGEGFSDNSWTDSQGHRGFGVMPSSVLNYLGIPTSLSPYAKSGVSAPVYPSLSVSDLPNRAYRLIWNEFFRDQNVQSPVFVPLDDSSRQYRDSASIRVELVNDYGGRPLKVNKFHDYFTSCLPAPQKGPAVSLGFPERLVPVNSYGLIGRDLSSEVDPVHFSHSFSVSDVSKDWNHGNLGNNYALYVDPSSYGVGGNPGPVASKQYFAPDNLYADFKGINLTSVNVLREAFAVQRLFEAFARGGTRYREMLKSIFGVTAPDYRVQVPEYLGGDRVPINMDQVLQTSSTDTISPQGNTAGYSLTTNVEHSFTKSFVEHGMVIGLACIRVEHTYCQGVEPYWFRKNLFDFYFPQFANLSEQPVYKKYLCATGFSEYDDSVFGYQEAWADYRFSPNRLSGSFSPDSYNEGESLEDSVPVYRNSSLADAWTYNDFYKLSFDEESGSYRTPDFSKLPTLSAGWMKEDYSNIGQTLAVQNEPQFICDFRFNVTAVRPMPVRSVPGLIDHH